MNKQEKETYKKTLELFNNECALCNSNEVAMHHIRYGACGRKTYMGNVIPLCERCHRLIHTNKKKYQPMLIDLINKKMEAEHNGL